IHFPCSITSYLIKYVKKRTLKILHLNGISANFCCFIIGDLSPLLPEPVTYYLTVVTHSTDPLTNSLLTHSLTSNTLTHYPHQYSHTITYSTTHSYPPTRSNLLTYSPSYSYSPIRSHTHRPTHLHSNTHTCSLTYSPTCSYSPVPSNPFVHTLTDLLTHTPYSLTLANLLTYLLILTRSLKPVSSHTHYNAHPLAHSSSLPLTYSLIHSPA